MNCPHCQAPNADDARFCGSCGRATSATEPASNPNLGEAPAVVGREIVLAMLVLAGGGVGIYMAVRGSNGPADLDTPDPTDTDVVDDVVDPDEPLEVEAPSPSGKGLPSACERFSMAIEKLAKCGILPAETRKALLDASKQFRTTFSQKLDASTRAQLTEQCEQMATNYETMVTQMNCGSP